MDPITIATAIAALVDVWASVSANQAEGGPTPEYIEAQNKLRAAQMTLLESLK